MSISTSNFNWVNEESIPKQKAYLFLFVFRSEKMPRLANDTRVWKKLKEYYAKVASTRFRANFTHIGKQARTENKKNTAYSNFNFNFNLFKLLQIGGYSGAVMKYFYNWRTCPPINVYESIISIVIIIIFKKDESQFISSIL